MITDDRIRKTELEKLFRAHFTVLCHFALKYLGDMDSCKEIVHSVFVRLWENRDEFDWEQPAKSYLFTAVYNRSMNFIRDRKKFDAEGDPGMESDPSNTAGFEDSLEAAELESRIGKALQKLPLKCREIFELSRYEGKKYAEIACDLKISVKTVETQMSRALKILRDELRDYLYLLILFLLKNLDQL